jgi:RimJ/RimL family protein N-acetyltransferase
MTGHFCRVEPLDPERHAQELFEANQEDAEGRNWTYLPEDHGPHPSLHLYREWAERAAISDDPLWHAIIEAESGRGVGVAAYARIDRTSGVIEVGGINYSPRLQRRPAATEAMYLLMRRAFDELGYLRYEWKCDSLNAASCAAALRLGFRSEGLFQQAVVYKGRNRDTAWFSVTDAEWPALRRGFECWLDPTNFNGEGRQRASLASLRHSTCRSTSMPRSVSSY